MEKFVDFTSGKTGQRLRIVVGAILVMLAVLVLESSVSIITGALGVLLILSGVLKVCIFNKLVGRPLNACPPNK